MGWSPVGIQLGQLGANVHNRLGVLSLILGSAQNVAFLSKAEGIHCNIDSSLKAHKTCPGHDKSRADCHLPTLVATTDEDDSKVLWA